MKILIIQLTRLGDIFQSWPAIRAIRRTTPAAEIHVLVRKRFLSALDGLEGIDRVHVLDTKSLLAPVIDPVPEAEKSLDLCSSWVQAMEAEHFDQVINLSFSPSSAWLARLLERAGSAIRGYSRFSDGSLKLSDPISEYFFAQSGRERSSRIHLSKLYGGLCGVDLEREDWIGAEAAGAYRKDRILVQVGASEGHKTLPSEKWIRLLSELSKSWSGEIAIIGSESEAKKSETIVNSVSSDRILDLTGKTTIAECFKLCRESKLILAPDSMLLHMGALTGTPTFNLSSPTVNFYETGPLSPGSVVVRAADQDQLPLRLIAQVIPKMIEGLELKQVLASDTHCDWYQVRDNVHQLLESYEPIHLNSDIHSSRARAWSLIEYLYFEGEIPKLASALDSKALHEVVDICNLVIESLEKVRSGLPMERYSGILARSDELLSTIGRILPDFNPLLAQFVGEKVAIPPGSREDLINATEACYVRLLARATAILTGGSLEGANRESTAT